MMALYDLIANYFVIEKQEQDKGKLYEVFRGLAFQKMQEL